MYSAKPGLLIGFHGCDLDVRDDIVSGKKEMIPSVKDHEWLGKGFYFWENNYQRALDFAQNHPDPKKIQTPAVLGAILDLQNCLDLLDTEFLRLARIAYQNLEFFADKSGMQLPANKTARGSKDLLIRNLDCAVIENVHRIQKDSKATPFDSVRGVFVEGNELYAGAGFHEKNHIQICIRNPNCIKGFFIPRKDAAWP